MVPRRIKHNHRIKIHERIECQNGSPEGIGNSMIWVLNVDDVVFAVIAILFPIFNDKPHGGTGQCLEVIFMIFSHGLYHKYLTLLNYPAAKIIEVGLVAYSVSVFIVSTFTAGGFEGPKTFELSPFAL